VGAEDFSFAPAMFPAEFPAKFPAKFETLDMRSARAENNRYANQADAACDRCLHFF
jgi:hypothetical protein